MMFHENNMYQNKATVQQPKIYKYDRSQPNRAKVVQEAESVFALAPEI